MWTLHNVSKPLTTRTCKRAKKIMLSATKWNRFLSRDRRQLNTAKWIPLTFVFFFLFHQKSTGIHSSNIHMYIQTYIHDAFDCNKSKLRQKRCSRKRKRAQFQILKIYTAESERTPRSKNLHNNHTMILKSNQYGTTRVNCPTITCTNNTTHTVLAFHNI